MPLHNDEHREVYGTFEQCSVTGNGTGGFASIFFPCKIEDNDPRHTFSQQIKKEMERSNLCEFTDCSKKKKCYYGPQFCSRRKGMVHKSK